MVFVNAYRGLGGYSHVCETCWTAFRHGMDAALVPGKLVTIQPSPTSTYPYRLALLSQSGEVLGHLSDQRCLALMTEKEDIALMIRVGPPETFRGITFKVEARIALKSASPDFETKREELRVKYLSK